MNAEKEQVASLRIQKVTWIILTCVVVVMFILGGYGGKLGFAVMGIAFVLGVMLNALLIIRTRVAYHPLGKGARGTGAVVLGITYLFAAGSMLFVGILYFFKKH